MATDARVRLRQLGQIDLGAWVEAVSNPLWSIQRNIAAAGSRYRARVAVPSCTASGKTFLAARLALAFFDAYTPGTPCSHCQGPCGGSRVITLASKHEHLQDVMWSEIRGEYEALRNKGVLLPGRMGVGRTLRLDDGPNHLMLGTSPSNAEGLQGVHEAHLLVIGDEATALPEEVTKGLVSSLATGDARQLLIFNPTTTETWAYEQCQSSITDVIKIRAWDTPLFTGEAVPPGSYLLTPEYLEELKASGQGPGTFDWVTKVEADFWDLGEDTLVPGPWYDTARGAPWVEGTRQLGIDLAPYGSAESVIAVRDGNGLVAVEAFPSMRMDTFFEGPVTKAVRRYAPNIVVYDADGVGAGVIGYAEKAARSMLDQGHGIQLLPFRGALGVQTKFTNARSSWWWHLRAQFEAVAISVQVEDPKLRDQLIRLKYRITDAGDIRVETKEELRRRDRGDLDRADAVMYAWALSDVHISAPTVRKSLADEFGIFDRSAEAMWERDMAQIASKGQKRDRFEDDWW